MRGNNRRCWRDRLESDWEGSGCQGWVFEILSRSIGSHCSFLRREVKWSDLYFLTSTLLFHFTLQFKAECYFENGTEHVRHVHRAIYNRQEYARFDSDLGKFVAVTELGRCSAEYWNSQKEILENVRAEVDTVCIYNYKSYNSFFLFSPAHPKVTVYPSKMAPPGHHNLLVCSVSGFYPGDIKVQWFLNGREETAGVTLVMLEMTHRRGDVYTCQVEHSMRQSSLTLQSQSESAQSKMLSGVGGLVLGLIFLGVGLIVHKRSQKGERLWGKP
uniref:Ig-like domain-containing protein n=1 Tax=Sarcophilus harrisii TaxID=9305 RepID=A0A7N4PJP1_SARHA